jgi:glutathione S-transferase
MAMARLVCHILPGSPFARMVRVLARELGQNMEEIVVDDFPPDPDLMRINPLGQVPVLVIGQDARFPTDIALAALGDAAHQSAPVPAPLRLSGYDLAHRQGLSVLLGLGDQIVARQYRLWAGVVSSGQNRLGFDLDQRAMVRIETTLNWLESRATPHGFDPAGLSLPDIALACILLWTESRGPIPWRGRPRLEGIVEAMSRRDSFAATVPPPYAG